jgi:hypothetical protein
VLLENEVEGKIIGEGLAFRFNNFKNRALQEQADSYERLDRMLKKVKLLLKKQEAEKDIEELSIEA